MKRSWNDLTFDQRPLSFVSFTIHHVFSSIVLFLDLGEGHDHNALVFGPGKHRKGEKKATTRKSYKEGQRQGRRTMLKRDLCDENGV